ncbi:MAG: hypothetical protein E6Q97_26650 [Desulfurellales bacterium]|nr:MAG: hypothetical protein E6Q97_26650 [Desulfurellales bacterium]
MDWYNLNGVRGYPFDERSTLASDAGSQIPPDVIVDCSIRFPDTLGQLAFVSALRVTAAATSVVISTAPNLDTPSLVVIASLVITGRPVPGQPYRLRALHRGCDGWLVFGASTADFQGRFSLPRQSALLPRTARGYVPLPIPWVSRELDERRLVDTVRLLAGNDVEIVSGTYETEHAVHDAIYVRLRGDDLQGTLQRYTGPCGGRPESRTCTGSPIEVINEVVPVDGNIQMDFEGITAHPLAHGILLNTDLSLPGLCAHTTVTDNPVDICSEPLVFSEIVDGPGDDPADPDTDSELASEIDTSEFVPSPYPQCVRFFDPPGAENSAYFTLLHQRGTWELVTAVPDTFPCSANARPPDTWRSARVVAVADGPGTYGPHFRNALLLHDDPAYPAGFEQRLQTDIRLPTENAPGRIGFVLDYQARDLRESGLFVGLSEGRLLEVARLVDGQWVNLSAWAVGVVPANTWVTLSVWITQNPRQPTVADMVVRLLVPGWRRAAEMRTFGEFSGATFLGRNGLVSAITGANFAYYHIDNVP